MINKKFMILTIFLLSLLAVSAVSAADNTTGDIVNIEEATNEAVSADENQAILKENNNVGTFDELANEINATDEGGVLTLTKDYKYTTGSRYGIQINKAITIDGKGHTLDGNKLSRIFQVAAEEVILKEITFINGHAKNSHGGAVEWKGTNGVLANCSFINSHTDWNGGAVRWEGYNGVLANCSFINSSARNGGAVSVSSSSDYSVLANCNFINSYAQYMSGAVYWEGSTGSLIDCSFINSSAKQDGGAVSVSSLSSILANCLFINSSTWHDSRDSGDGGAVRWSGYNGTLINCMFINSYAYMGLGGAVVWYANNGVLANSSFINSSAKQDGGAVYWQGKNGVLANCSFTNTAAENGGAVYLNTFSINGTLSDCSFVNCSARSIDDYSLGGAIIWCADYGMVARSTFINCTAESDSKTSYGGGIYFKGNNCSLITPSYFEGNTAKYGPDWYSSKPLNIDGTKITTAFDTSDVVATYKSNANIIATLKDINGNPIKGAKVKITFNRADKTLTTNNNGQTSLPLKNVYPGNYIVALRFDGDMAYEKTNTAINVIINKADTIISAPDITVAYKDTKGKLVATITNQYNNPLPVNVNVNINGKTYTVKADTEGKITIPTNTLYPGTYTATITYTGNNNYNPTTTIANVVVTKANTKITAKDTTTTYKDPTGQLVATLKNAYGNALSVNVNVNLNGQNHTIKADSQGKITIPTKDLPTGTHIATINYNGNNNYNPSSTTAKIIIEKANTKITPKDTTVTYKNTKEQLVATLKDNYGNEINDTANVKINGKTYKIQSDKGKIIITTANLYPGNYVATITYKGNSNYNPSSTTANIIVTKANTKITAKDTTTTYKDTDGKLVATITNQYNNPLPVNVKVNLNGKTYTVKADTEGKITIPTDTLYPGTYTATITYEGNNNYNPTTTTVKITVNKANTNINAPDITVNQGDANGKLVATITNQYNNPLPVSLNININGQTHTIKADSNGQATWPTKNLAKGTYTATITYTGNGNYNPTNTAAIITVK